ncbi:hypothetical protein CKM354_000448600 [Cercospora kikuchii]|uniref:Secreted protein n=1 Tax=Cercospora kikuchii TaxID=84275 RepID=A0A9P3CE96_9PEZI|nr:uncharacterized protein CKM354_000448600 [Cercospora kikuchii]GIZ41171.1 hypothetical protein CKM354_000448600 [Cercospora kikuchii]
MHFRAYLVITCLALCTGAAVLDAQIVHVKNGVSGKLNDRAGSGVADDSLGMYEKHAATGAFLARSEDALQRLDEVDIEMKKPDPKQTDANVPGLCCGWGRAINCGRQFLYAFADCATAAETKGKAIITVCSADIAAFGGNWNTCKWCICQCHKTSRPCGN